VRSFPFFSLCLVKFSVLDRGVRKNKNEKQIERVEKQGKGGKEKLLPRRFARKNVFQTRRKGRGGGREMEAPRGVK